MALKMVKMHCMKIMCMQALLLMTFAMAGEPVTPNAEPALTEIVAPATPPLAASLEGTNVKETARIRLYGLNGVSVKFCADSNCYDRGKSVTVSGGAGDAFKSFFGRVKNTSIGMTATPCSANPKLCSMLLSKAYFREYEIPSNKPMVIQMSYQTTGGWYCREITISFKPETGKEYESMFKIKDGKCYIVLNEITVVSGRTLLNKVPCTAAEHK